jgi:hypothetical protein
LLRGGAAWAPMPCMHPLWPPGGWGQASCMWHPTFPLALTMTLVEEQLVEEQHCFNIALLLSAPLVMHTLAALGLGWARWGSRPCLASSAAQQLLGSCPTAWQAYGSCSAACCMLACSHTCHAYLGSSGLGMGQGGPKALPPLDLPAAQQLLGSCPTAWQAYGSCSAACCMLAFSHTCHAYLGSSRLGVGQGGPKALPPL